MSATSRRKGKDGERQLRDLLREHGFAAERGAQHRGGPTSPDVVCTSLPGIHFECKRTERIQIRPAINQAIHDAGTNRIPVVAWRQNRGEWLCCLRASDLLEILRRSDLVSTTP